MDEREWMPNPVQTAILDRLRESKEFEVDKSQMQAGKPFYNEMSPEKQSYGSPLKQKQKGKYCSLPT